MFMHKYTDKEALEVFWIFAARGYSPNADRCLQQLWASDLLTTEEAKFWASPAKE